MANLGLVYGSLRQFRESIVALEGAWIAYPHPRVRWMLADMYSAVGRSDAATELLKHHLEQPFDWIVYSKHLLVGGQRDAAADALKRLNGRRISAGASWADLALVQADFHRAEGHYREARRRSSRASIAAVRRAWRGSSSRWLRCSSIRAGVPRRRRRSGATDAQHSRESDVHGSSPPVPETCRPPPGCSPGSRGREGAARAAPGSAAPSASRRIALANGRVAEAYAHARLAVRAFPTAYTSKRWRARRGRGQNPRSDGDVDNHRRAPGRADARLGCAGLLTRRAGTVPARPPARTGRASRRGREAYDQFCGAGITQIPISRRSSMRASGGEGSARAPSPCPPAESRSRPHRSPIP